MRSGALRLAGVLPAAAAGMLLSLGACDGAQSAFRADGANAREVLGLWWLMVGVLTAAFVVVLSFLLYALFGPRPSGRARGAHWIVGGGVVLPGVTVLVFLLAGLRLDWVGTYPDPERPTIDVVARQYWWEIRYPAPDGGEPVISANELWIPVGEPVHVRLHAADVIHSFWVPSLAGKTDMIPGRVNEMRLVAERPGTWRGQCAEFCGLQHANMAFYVRAVPRPEFEARIAHEARPAAAPGDPFLARGARAFVSAGCGSCHAVRGTPAAGRVAPDLTHVGSRLTIGAAMLDTSVGTLAGWTASAQHIKPGNRMPSFTGLDGETLRALAAWLDSLE